MNISKTKCVPSFIAFLVIIQCSNYTVVYNLSMQSTGFITLSSIVTTQQSIHSSDFSRETMKSCYTFSFFTTFVTTLRSGISDQWAVKIILILWALFLEHLIVLLSKLASCGNILEKDAMVVSYCSSLSQVSCVS